MNWFTGSIPEAIGLAKSTDAIFVVYVYDSSDASTATSETLAEAELATVLNSKKFVAIKLENGTEGSNQFSQIYPVVILPSLYFISGSTGIPLEILGGAVAKDKLKEKLKEFTKDAQIPAASSNVTEEPSGAAPEKMEVEETSTSTAVVNDNSSKVLDSPVDVPSESEKEEVESMSEESSDAAGNPAVPLEERLDRAKALLNEKQAKKAEEAAEELRKKEVERRKIGQEVAKRKRQMHDEEIQTAARERKKEKDEDRAARERVKAQIAADRLERETRAALLQGDAPVPAQELPSAESAAPAFSTNRDDAVTRLKFRLPDGSSSIAQFPIEATLSEVRQHVQQLVSSSSFALTSTVHHRPFTSQDDETSLLDLGLVPTAIIVVLLNARPYAGSSVVSSEGGMMQFLWILLSPITFLLGFVRQIFSGGSGGAAASHSSTNEPGGERTSAANHQQRPSSSYGRRQRENRPNREGNIHRLNNSNDDDDNNTWNGNSTQQM